MSSDDLEENLNKYKQPSELRNFKIVTKTDDVYVNINYLAEISEYFHCICTKQFLERNENQLILEDVYADELVDFLSYVCPNNFQFEKNISADNICNLAYFSDRLIFPHVKTDIKNWLAKEQFKDVTFIPSVLVEAALMLNQQGLNITEMEPIFKKLALMDTEQITKALEQTDRKTHDYLLDKIRMYKPYEFTSRPNSYYNYQDYRARIFF